MTSPDPLEHIEQLFTTMVSGPNPTLDDRRRGYDSMLGTLPIPADAWIRPGVVGGVDCVEVCAAGAAEPGTVILSHGGGYVMGSASGYRSFACAVSRATHRRVLIVDYRLAPEHPYPAAVDDVVAVYAAVRAERPGEPVVLLGDSAGGGLTLGVTAALRDDGAVLPEAVVAISAMTDLAGTGRSLDAHAAVDPVVRRAGVMRHGGYYLGGRRAESTPYASPLYADADRFPPTFLLVGDREALLDDTLRLRENLAAAGVEVRLLVEPGMVHVWPVFAAILPAGQRAVDAIGAFVAEHIAESSVVA